MEDMFLTFPKKRAYFHGKAGILRTNCGASVVKHSDFLKRALFIIAAAACLTPWASAPLALIGGFAFAQMFGNPFARVTGKATGWLLKASVVGLGFGMNIHTALEVGREGLWLTAGSIVLVLILGYVIGGRLGMPRRVSHLIASGTAICGGSAIAAVGPAVRASAQEMSVALGVVFFLNAVALLVFPPIGHMLGLSQFQFGMWCAIAIHDTSSVVGAASAYGKEALLVAATVKLARALWIIPLSLLSAYFFKSRGTKITVPLFILFFILAMLANSWLPLPAAFTGGIVAASKASLVVCLFLIGASLSLETIRSVGWKPLALGLSLWAAIGALALFAVLRMG